MKRWGTVSAAALGRLLVAVDRDVRYVRVGSLALVWYRRGRPAIDPASGSLTATDDVLLAQERARYQTLADLVTYLALHIGRYEWTQLTTEQKELLADLIDASHARQDEEEQTPEGGRYTPVERWWRG